MAEWVADAFEDNGHLVVKHDRNAVPQPQDLSADIDLVFVVDCSEDFSGRLLRYSQPMVFWSYDAHMPGGIERSTNIARKCDLTFSMNYEHGKLLLDKFGVENYWMPSTYSNRLLTAPSEPPEQSKYDVVMIGHVNSPQREELFNILMNRYNCLTGKVENQTHYTWAMANAKIIVNQPTEPWDIITGIRFFEALGFGGLCLQKVIQTQELEKLGFRNGEHFAYWSNFDDLIQKIDLYLADETERKRIALQGHNKVHHMSMRHQVAKIEQIILNKFYDRL